MSMFTSINILAANYGGENNETQDHTKTKTTKNNTLNNQVKQYINGNCKQIEEVDNTEEQNK